MGQNAAAILQWLLSEADFFVDEKDLQTFVGAALAALFFCLPCAHARSATLCALADWGFRRLRLQAPVFHYVVPGVHWRTQQVLPVIAVPRSVRFDLVCRLRAVYFDQPMKTAS